MSANANFLGNTGVRNYFSSWSKCLNEEMDFIIYFIQKILNKRQI
jgi:hypothetical protein